LLRGSFKDKESLLTQNQAVHKNNSLLSLKLYFMNYDYEQTEFSKSLLAGVFAGISATILSLLYNAFFRGIIGFNLSDIINVSTIIFALMTVVTIAGVIFYFFHHYLRRGTLVFQLASVLITVLLIVGSMQIQRSDNPVLSEEFRELLWGIIGITGICTVFIIPFLYKNDYI